MDFPGWMASSFAVSFHRLEVLPSDLYLAGGVLHAVNEAVDSVAGTDLCLDEPVNTRAD